MSCDGIVPLVTGGYGSSMGSMKGSDVTAQTIAPEPSKPKAPVARYKLSFLLKNKAE